MAIRPLATIVLSGLAVVATGCGTDDVDRVKGISGDAKGRAVQQVRNHYPSIRKATVACGRQGVRQVVRRPATARTAQYRLVICVSGKAIRAR